MTERELQRLLSRPFRKQALVDLNPNAFAHASLASFNGPMMQQAMHPTYTFGQGMKDMVRGGRDRIGHFARAVMPGGGHAGGNSVIDNIGAGLFRDNHPLLSARNFTEPFKRMQAEPDYQHATRKVTGLTHRWRVPGMQGDTMNDVMTNRLIPDLGNRGGPFGVPLPPWWNSYLNTGAGGPMTSQSLGQMQGQAASQGIRGFRRPVESSINAF